MNANIFEDIPPRSPDEHFTTFAETGFIRIERIVSYGQATPEGQWLEQAWDEWVVLLTGAAALLFEGEEALRRMEPGDHLLIPAHRLHRVAWTDQEAATVWLAVHYRPES